MLLRFAADLRNLREQAGSPTYRELGQRAHYSAGTLSDAAGGRKLPSLGVTLAYVRACGGDPVEWERRWRTVAAELQAEETGNGPSEDDERSPYVGLAAFGTEDADRFLGRERLIDEVLARLARYRLVPVFGVSGAGKSSLLRAGVLPRLRGGDSDGLAVVFTPGARPLEECAIHLARLTGSTAGLLRTELAADPENLHRAVRQAVVDRSPSAELVLVVDQFEEVFTLCRDDEERSRFLDALLRATGAENSRCRVVLGVRADFYAHCAARPELARALTETHVTVGPMTTDELRRAITGPAVQAGCAVEGALLARIVADATEQAGVLPLMSHALLETWRRRRGNTLTLAGYEAAGGIHGAVTKTAENAYTALEPEQQRRARQILLRLVALGEGTQDTKRRVARSELDEDANTAVVLDTLADARLVTLGQDSIEIAHEALVRHWPRLRGWLAEDRDGLRIHRQVTEAAADWEAVERDPGALYRGVRLSLARAWADEHCDSLTDRESAFLRASITADAREQAATQHRTRQLRVLAATLAILLVAAVAISVVAMRARDDAVVQGNIATSRQLAAEAQTAAGRDVAQAIRAALEAYQRYPTPEARSAVLSLASRHDYDAQLPAPYGVNAEVAFSSTGGWFATPGKPGTIELWDLGSHTRIRELNGQFGQVVTLTFSVDSEGREHLAAGTSDGQIVLWDVGSGTELNPRITVGGGVRRIRLSPDGRTLATVNTSNVVKLWNATHGTPLATVTAPAGQSVAADIAIRPDGRELAFTDADGRIGLWDLTGSAPVATLPVARYPWHTLAYSPDGRMLAVAGPGTEITLWDTGTRQHIADLPGHQTAVLSLAFDPTGGRLVSVDAHSNLFAWDVARRAKIGQLVKSRNNSITSATFSPDGRFIAGTGSGGSTLLWSRSQLPFLGHTDTVAGIAYSPDGFSMVSRSIDGNLIFWDNQRHLRRVLAPGGTPVNLRNLGPPAYSRDGRLLVTSEPTGAVLRDTNTFDVVDTVSGPVTKAIFSPDSRTLAILGAGVPIRLWDITARRAVDRVLDGDVPVDLAYAPDGRLLAVATRGGVVQLWDTTTYTPRATLKVTDGPALAVTFSPDGKRLAVTGPRGPEGKVSIWDTETFARIAELTSQTDQISSTTFSPDQRFLATMGTDNTVTLWDGATYTAWATLTGHTAPVSAIAWSPDGTLASGSRDQTIIPWTTDTHDAIRRLCTSLSHDFPSPADPPALCDGP